jgi:hypothetical protein
MARIQYVVEPDGAGAWKISYAEKEFGPYRTQGEAISAAVDAAYRAGAENSEGAQVVLHGSDGLFLTEWNYGKDLTLPSNDLLANLKK